MNRDFVTSPPPPSTYPIHATSPPILLLSPVNWDLTYSSSYISHPHTFSACPTPVIMGSQASSLLDSVVIFSSDIVTTVALKLVQGVSWLLDVGIAIQTRLLCWIGRTTDPIPMPHIPFPQHTVPSFNRGYVCLYRRPELDSATHLAFGYDDSDQSDSDESCCTCGLCSTETESQQLYSEALRDALGDLDLGLSTIEDIDELVDSDSSPLR